MHGLATVVLTIGLAFSADGLAGLQEPHPPHHVFQLGDLELESGEVLRDAHLLYATHGRLNAARSNAILLPTAFLGNHHSYDGLIGPGRALDPARYFVIVSEQFGSGGSSSPSNAASTQSDDEFPAVSIRDNVAAMYRLVTDELEIPELVAVVGFSMGAQQAFQMAVSHPDFIQLIVPIAGMAKTYPHAAVRIESALALITGDASIRAGHDTLSTAGKRAWGLHWLAWIYSPEWWRQGQFQTAAQPNVDAVIRDAVALVPHSRPRDYVVQGRAWRSHDVGTTPGFNSDLSAALRSIRARVLYMPGTTDMYFPIGDAEYERQFLRAVTWRPIPSVWGHIAGTGADPADLAFMDDAIRTALAEVYP